MKRSVLPWYALLLIVLLCAALMSSSYEGFTSSPSTFYKDIEGKKVFALFYTKSCPHCVELKPKWDEAESKMNEKLVAIEMSDQSDPVIQEISKKYKINSYPTMLILDNGVLSAEYKGDRTPGELISFAKSHLGDE